MLGVPKWMTETAIPLTFSLLLAQTIVEIIALAKAGPGGSFKGAADVEQIEE